MQRVNNRSSQVQSCLCNSLKMNQQKHEENANAWEEVNETLERNEEYKELVQELEEQ